MERNGSKQLEYAEGGGKLKMELDVEWIDDCSYLLKVSKIIENPENWDVPKGIVFKVEIIEIGKNYYVQQASSNMYGLTRKKKVIRLE